MKFNDLQKPDSRARLRAILYSPTFERFITALIVINAVILGLLTYRQSINEISTGHIRLLLVLDFVIIVIFTLEILLKIYADGRNFFRSGWNIFDFLVVALGLLGTGYPLTILRSLRVLRVFRLVTRVPSMQVVVESFLRSLPGIGSVLTVMLLVLFVFSVIGTSLFRTIAPDMFGSLQDSAFTLFTVLTLEGWPDVARDVMDKAPWAWVFFVVYIAVNSFAVLNLMIAVIITAMQKDYEDHAEEEREDMMDELKAIRAELARLNADRKPDLKPRKRVLPDRMV